MANPYHSPIRVLAKAKTKYEALNSGIKTYLASDFHAEVKEFDLKSGCHLYKHRITRFPGEDIADLAYEIIDHQRSALDQIAYVTAVMSGVTGNALERIHFPISRVSADFENAIKRSCNGLHPDIKTLFRSFKAHPGGNDILVELNGVRKKGFHRFIVPVATVANVTPGLASMQGKPAYIPAPVWDSKKHEIICKSESDYGRFSFDAELTFNVAFGEVDSVAGKPVATFLHASYAEIVDILELTMRKTAKIGLCSMSDYEGFIT
jgi:hypothetical protein